MTTWRELLSEVRPRNHIVQLYEDDDLLTRRVSHYLREGLERQEAVIAIASQPHRESFTEQLARDEVDVDKVLGERQLILFDADDLLSRFMTDGQPDEAKFQATVGDILEESGGSFRGLRLYGEMVDVLWREGNVTAALRLEHLWHQLLHRQDLPLLCAYRIDILDRTFRESSFQSVLAIHSHLVPVGSGDELELSVNRAMEEVLGREKVETLRPLMAAAHYPRVTLCRAESAVIWVSRALPEYRDEILARARLHYTALRAETEVC